MPGTYRSPIETGFYYIHHRYYDPQLCRWINADSLASTGQGFLGCNMFAYCGNNPANETDSSGNTPNDEAYTFEDFRHGGWLFVSLALSAVTAYASKEQEITISIDASFAKSQVRSYRSGQEKHHLVAKGARNAEYARAVLNAVGININDPENLMMIKTSLHRRIHTDLYYGWANSVVIAAYRNAGNDQTEQQEAVYSALETIRSFLKAIDLISPY